MMLNEGDKDYDYKAFLNDPQWKKTIDSFGGNYKQYLAYLQKRKKVRQAILDRERKESFTVIAWNRNQDKKRYRNRLLNDKQRLEDDKKKQRRLL